MEDLDSIDVPASQFIQCHNVFGIMVPDLKKVDNLPV